MSYILIVTIAIVIFSLVFDFINGFHDTANAVATAVSTRALTPRSAILLGSNELYWCLNIYWGSRNNYKGYC